MPDIYDGAFKLLDHDPLTGRSLWMAMDADGNKTFRIDQPLEDIFTANHEAEAETHGRRFGDWNRVASVPHHLAYASGFNEALSQQDHKWISRFLNSSDNEKLRTSRGRV